MLMKICKCGRRLRQDQICSCQRQRHKIYDEKIRDKSARKFYASTKWKKITEIVKARAHGLDEYLLAMGIIQQGSTVHHIYTIDERPELREDLSNLIFVSAKTHNKIHAQYAKGDAEKKELQKFLKERVGVSWQEDREKLSTFLPEKSAKKNA